MTIIADRLAQLDGIHLFEGMHSNFDDGHCAMEVVAWLAGEGHTDAPHCASVVLRRFTIGLNDAWTDEQRQDLVPFLPRMVGTGDDGKDKARAFMCADWAVRECLPIVLDAVGKSDEAQQLRALEPITDVVTAHAGRDKAREVRKAAYAAYAATDAAAAAYAATDAATDAATATDAAYAAYASAYAATDAYAAYAATDAAAAATDAYAEVRASALGLLDRLITAA